MQGPERLNTLRVQEIHGRVLFRAAEQVVSVTDEIARGIGVWTVVDAVAERSKLGELLAQQPAAPPHTLAASVP